VIETIITGHADRPSTVKKFVITVFADVPRAGTITCYAEVCAASSEPFVLLLPVGAVVKSRHDLYSDSETCTRFLSEYELIDRVTGRHRQRVGDEILDVTPSRASISMVAPPEGHTDVTAFLVTFPAQSANASFHGTWLVWSHSVSMRLSNSPTARYQVALKAETAKLDHFYLFLVLPLGHDAINSICLLGSANPMGGQRPTNPIHKFDLEYPFPVFPEWRSLIYGRQVLRTRDDVALGPSEQAVLQLQTRSEDLQGRVTTLAYVTGLGFALSANVLTNALFYLQDKGMERAGLIAMALS
jgi:hypothetical protein